MEVNVSVAVRVRPPPQATTPDRLGDHVNVSLGPFPNCITVNNVRPFQFDHVLPMDCTQSQLFENTVEPLVPYLLEGYDTTIVAYGQAGSGKSYTILGPGPHCALSETEYGIVPRATREIFNRMRLYPERRFRVFVTFVEIYQEVLRDLLNPNSVHNNLHIKEDPCIGMKVEGAEHVECQTIIDVFNCLLTGMNNRRQGERAHTIFSLLVEQQILSSDQSVQHKVSQLLLVDLAGSERLCSEGSVRLDSSLAALGNLVHALATQQSYQSYLNSFSPQQSHLPYRDSKLTHLLKGSLGGRAICLFVCCISSMASDTTDTLNTLSCGNLVKVVRNRPTMNHFVGPIAASLFDENRSHSNPASFADNMFGMEFVMLQWKKLVSDAEGLFQQITEGQGLTVDDLEHIQRWLCLKQECEEIVASQQADSLGQLLHRSLDVIGELSESEEKASDIDAPDDLSDEEVEEEEEEEETEDIEEEEEEEEEDEEEEKNDSNSESPVKSYVSNNQSDVELEARRISTPEFINNLDSLIEDFKLKTDIEIQKIQDKESAELQELQNKDEHQGLYVQASASAMETHRLVARRNSIRPDTNAAQIPSLDSHPPNANLDLNGVHSRTALVPQNTQTTVMLHISKSPQMGSELVDHCDELQTENRQNQMKHVLLDLQGISAKINELQHTIQLKEEMLQDLVKNREVRLAAKQRLERKLRRTQDAYKNSQLKLAQIEKMVQHQKHPTLKLREDLEKFQHAVQTYKQRLKDITSIQHLAEDSAEKAIELEHSLTASRRQLEKLKRQLRKEERLKVSVEREIQKEEMALKHSDQSKVSKENVTCSVYRDDENNESQDTLKNSKSIPLDNSNIFKNGINPSSLHDTREGATMRRAIRKLRKTKDCLINQRYELNRKFRLEKSLSPEEERKLLELEEAIEAIDAAIEYKNEILCGRSQDLTCIQTDRDKGEALLMERLVGLSLAETKMLLYKYFHKVIDLRDSSKKLEVQVAEHETQAELHTWRFQALSHALQQARYATERQLVSQQRDHEEQLHLLLRHCAEESSCSGAEGSSTAITPRYELELRRENKILRRKLEEAQITVHTSTSGRKNDPNLGALAIPETNLRRLQATSAIPTTTKITREKNKLVIQQHKRRKSP